MADDMLLADEIVEFIINGICDYPDSFKEHNKFEMYEEDINSVAKLLCKHEVPKEFTGIMCFFYQVIEDEYYVQYDYALKSGFAEGQRKDFSWGSKIRSELDDLKLLFKQVKYCEDAYWEEWKKVDDNNDESQFPKELEIQIIIKTNSNEVLPVKLSHTLSNLVLKAIQENDAYKKMQEATGGPLKFQYSIASYIKRVVTTFHSMVCYLGIFNSKFEAEINTKARRFLMDLLELAEFQVDEHTGDPDKYLKDNFYRARNEGLLRAIGEA